MLILFLAAVATAAPWAVQLKPGVNASEWAEQHGWTYEGPVKALPAELNYHVFAPARKRVTSRALRSPQVVWAEEQHLRPRVVPRTADPLYHEQWHLHGSTWSVREPANLTGRGVTIAIVDDGLEHTHPEIAANYAQLHSFDYNGGTADPMPAGEDSHGTSAAGVAAAVADNGVCGKGVAPAAQIAGIRLIAGPVSDLTESTALSHHVGGNVDVVSCSWGPPDSGDTMTGPGHLTQQAMGTYAGLQHGRLGRGTIYVWAAGNGRQSGDSCSFDGYASSPYAIAVGAVDNSGRQAWYSESCPALMAVAPSSGNGGGITTADRHGQCLGHFGGTSAAAPLAAGIVALMLEERPELTWRDVKHIIARGALPVHTEDPSWRMNARGFRHSEHYGFGLLRTDTLLPALRAHQLVPPEKVWSTGMQPFHPPKGWLPYDFEFAVNNTGISFIEHVRLRVTIKSKTRGAISIALTSPSGAISMLAPERPNDRDNTFPLMGWYFTSVRHWGETPDGVWHVSVGDTSGIRPGNNHINAYNLVISGY